MSEVAHLVAVQTIRQLVAATTELCAAPVGAGGVTPAPPGQFVRVVRQDDPASGVPAPDHRGLHESAVRAVHACPTPGLARLPGGRAGVDRTQYVIHALSSQEVSDCFEHSSYGWGPVA
ncbi:hypothetical protein GCM10010269_72510 [Streptomyces humidus]|uniref:Uncharacterized protein n=1 Tax=Streptomyces humidus TaxID=52259 RepID=A0A918G8N0_9ACTN|nr:hypothetical protein GCM10010269_72510 [Streptomyces humidus]